MFGFRQMERFERELDQQAIVDSQARAEKHQGQKREQQVHDTGSNQGGGR
ncbi:MAG: hypothetical protein VX346_08430 [Planctomycetota bacterium]|nr:hypothetical protein [Planctomycetota bacterium]